ncbi:MAG: metallophosphoesterase [Candidatus Moranbacteria bacterium]|jgi:3',5'-cyclic AMP phosphodiesterase CpdA|nr:metallophosphoesterase [Candidatus Moranbacteria bacterium]
MNKLLQNLSEYWHKLNPLMIKNKKVIFVSIFLVVFLFSGFWTWKEYENNRPLKIGFVSDIHAANDKVRMADEEPAGYPRKYKEYFSLALDEMKREKVDAIVALGDNTNVGNPKYAQSLMKIMKEKKVSVIWVKGNHDRAKTKVMTHFGIDKTYYFQDVKNWRIIVLDSSFTGKDYTGEIDAEQMKWLKEALKTDSRVIIAMHHPIFDKENLDNIYPIYKDFVETISNSANVEDVFFGHFHKYDMVKEINGVKYHFVPSLTGNEKTPTFKIIEFEK